MSFPQSYQPKRPKYQGVPELSLFRSEIHLNRDYPGNKVTLLDGYSTMRVGETVHAEPKDPIKALSQYARRLVGNGYFNRQAVRGMDLYRSNMINFYQQHPNFDCKDDHILVLSMTPGGYHLAAGYRDDQTLINRLEELYHIIKTGEPVEAKRISYGRKLREQDDFAFRGKTYQDLITHCKSLTGKGYERGRVVGFYESIRMQYFPSYASEFTKAQAQAKVMNVGYPEQAKYTPANAREVRESLVNKFNAK